MKTNRWAVLLVLFMAGLHPVLAQDTVDALKAVAAPAKEFVRMPADFILLKLADHAAASGEQSLAGFSISNELPGSGERRISIDLAGMNLYEAIQTVAKAAGAGVEYRNGSAVLKDPAGIAAPPPVETPVAAVTAKPAEKRKNPERISFSEINNALVFVDTGTGRGSGFVARMDGKVYVFSNQHNFLGAQKIRLSSMSGKALKPATFELCRHRDLVRFELSPEDQEGLGVLDFSEVTPAMNEPIAVYGNSAGGNVATELLGEVIGVGPQDIEINADIVSGNSGSPVLDAAGRVLGVATYITLEQKFDKGDYRAEIYKNTRFKKPRRYAVRIAAQGWEQTSLKNYLDQSILIQDMRLYLEAMSVLVFHWFEDEDFDIPANRLISAYSRIGPVVDAPYAFRRPETEELLQMAVRGFKQNYDGIKGEFKDLRENEKDNLGGRINHILLKAVKAGQEQLAGTDWMSTVLKEAAAEPAKMAEALISALESNADPYIRSQREKTEK